MCVLLKPPRIINDALRHGSLIANCVDRQSDVNLELIGVLVPVNVIRSDAIIHQPEVQRVQAPEWSPDAHLMITDE